MTDHDPAHHRAQPRQLRGAWLGLVVTCAALIGAVETVLFEMATSALTEGYNNPRIGPAEFALGVESGPSCRCQPFWCCHLDRQASPHLPRTATAVAVS